MPAIALSHRGRNKKKKSASLQLMVVGNPPPFPRLQIVDRRGPVLRPNPMSAGGEEVLGLNVTSSCAMQCPFCFARAYPGEARPDAFYLFDHLAEQVRAELRQRRKPPRAVYLCPSTDPFPPFAEVQAETCRVVESLAELGVEAWIMTRGYIRPAALETLVRCKEHVRVTVAITSVNRDTSRLLEPFTAPPRLRLKQIRRLIQAGISTRAALEPLIPGLTDRKENLVPLLDALAETGVEHLSAGYMFLRHGIRANLREELGENEWTASLLARYDEGPLLPLGNTAPAKLLPRSDRQRGYALLTALAAARGMNVSLSRVTNPDFRPPEHESARRPERQMSLYN